MVEGVDEVTWINYVLDPALATNVKPFEVWLRERIDGVMAELRALEDG